MVRLQARLAALVGLAALVSAEQAPINCGNNYDYADKTPHPSDFTVYHSGSSDWDIRCHSFLRMPVYDWVYTGVNSDMEGCISRCAASSTCSAAILYGSECYLSNTATLSQGSLERIWPYVVAVKQTPLNCKNKANDGRIFSSPGSTTKYQIMCDYQFGGNTLGTSKRAETFEQCVGFCDTTSGCVDVVYSDAKYCWLKSSKTNGYVSPGWFSAVKLVDGKPITTTTSASAGVGSVNCIDNSADGTVFAPVGGKGKYDIRCNFQYDGDTLSSSKRTETFDQCINLCDGTTGCVDAIWSNAKYCWLKSSKRGNGYKSGGWFSAVKRTN